MLGENFGQSMGIGYMPKGSILQFEICSKFQSLIDSPTFHSQGNLSFKVERDRVNFDLPAVDMALVYPASAFSALD